MADIYGQSDRALAEAGALAYSDAAKASIAAGEKKIAEIVAQLGAGINRGYTPEETADLNTRLESAKTQIGQAKADLAAQVGFARQQTGIAAAQTDQQLRDISAAQLALAAQSLGQAGTTFTPGPSSTAMQGARLLQREAGATQGYIGGAGSVPAGAQIRTPGLALTPGSDAARGAELGLIGMNRQGQDLFTQAIMAGEIRSQADFDRQRINLAAQIEADARAAQRERVATEEARAKNFEQTAMQTMISNILSANNKVAELQAAAAASDNRTDKEKLLLEAKREQQRADIEAAKQIKIGKALAKSSGATTEAQNAALQSAILTTGASTFLGRVSSNSEKNMNLYGSAGPENWLVTPVRGSGNKKGNPVTTGGNSNSRWTYRDGFLTQYPTGDVSKPGDAIDVRTILTDITYKAGQLQGITNEKQRLDQWDAFFRGFTPSQRAALAVIYRQPDAAKSTWYHGYIVPAKPTAKK
jgi:hypothetical protein